MRERECELNFPSLGLNKAEGEEREKSRLLRPKVFPPFPEAE